MTIAPVDNWAKILQNKLFVKQSMLFFFGVTLMSAAPLSFFSCVGLLFPFPTRLDENPFRKGLSDDELSL